MRIRSDELRLKALLTLEEALQEYRCGRRRRSLGVRFACAYLWASSRADRTIFDDYWKCLGEPHSPWSFGIADRALFCIYQALDLQRDEDTPMRLWADVSRSEKGA